MRKRQGLRPRSHIRGSPTASEKLMDQTHAIVRPPTAITKSYGASGDIWDLLRFGTPTALLSKGLITPEQYSSLMGQQASAENPLPRYSEERQDLIEGPLPIKPLEEPSVEFLSEFIADPTNLLLGGVGMAGMTFKKALNRVFKAGAPLFSSKPAEATLNLVSDLKKQIEKGKKNIARRDKNTGEIVINKDYLKSRTNELYGKQAAEYAGFGKFLDDTKGATISIPELEDFWARTNLDIREIWHSRYDDQYNLPGGTNQRSVVITYHGKKPPMTKQTLKNLDNIAQHKYKKSFVDLSPDEQHILELDYHKWYPGDKSIDRGYQLNEKFEDSNTQLHHGKENVLFHLRMDDRVGVGSQSGQKILNVFEIQSDWYQRANREGMYDLEKYDADIASLYHKNRLLDEDIRNGSINNAMSVEDIAKIHAKKKANKTEIDKISDQRNQVLGELNTELAAPKAPFIAPGKGEQWVELALKRVLKLAVDGGYDRVTFGTREIQGKIYKGMIRPVSYFKVKRMKRSDEITLPKKQLDKDGTVLHPTIKVKGENYPYYLEAFDVNGNKIEHPEGPDRTIHHFSEDKLVDMFGQGLTDRIKKKAKHGRKTKVLPGQDETPDMGLENLGVLYDVTIPKVLKNSYFKDLGLELEKIPMGRAITPSEVQAADQQFSIDENFLSERGIELNDNWDQPEFLYNDVDGNRHSVDLEGLGSAMLEGRISPPPGGLDEDATITAARNMHNRLTGGVQGNLQNLGPPNRPQHQVPGTIPTDVPAMYNNIQDLVNPGGFEQRLDRYQHPMHRNRASADARSLLEDNGITFNETENGVTFNADENSPLADGGGDFYTSSWEYLQAYRRAGGHPTAIPEEVKLMREIEIANTINAVSDVRSIHLGEITENGILVDRQYINLMNPETREIELSHIEGELQTYGINIFRDATAHHPPRFGIVDGTAPTPMSYADAVTPIELDFNVGPSNFGHRIYNLARRYEIAGSPQVDPNEVLNVTQVESMPFHIEENLSGELPITHDEWLAENTPSETIQGAGLLENIPEYTERAIKDNPMQWSVKLNDKIKKAYKESPPPYALIPPGILAGEAARQSLLDENIW